MDNVKIAFGCVVLFALSLGLIILMLTSMDDTTKCRECDPLPLWISTNRSIVEINQSEQKAYIIISTKSRAIFFDFNFEYKEIYWVEEEDGVGLSTRMYKSGLRNINRTGEEGVVKEPGPRLLVEMGPCGGLALDWLHSHMYWIHRDTGLIMVATLDGGHRRVVYNNANSDIFTIVVDPVRRYLFWTETSWVNSSLAAPADIVASDLRGEHVHVVAPRSVEGVRTIALDVTERRLYYMSQPRVLAVCDYDGGNKVIVRADLPFPPSFSISNKQLFWTSAEGEVTTALKHTDNEENTFPVKLSLCQRCSHVERAAMFGPQTYLRVVDGRMQPIPDTDHHSYSQCLLNMTTASEVCPCPFGYMINNRSQACKEQGYFLASFGSELQAVSMRGRRLPLLYKRQALLSSVDIHVVKGLLFWYDLAEAKIFRSPLLSPSQRYTVALMVRGTSGLAVDWVYDHVYWTSNTPAGGCVEVCRLDGSSRTIIVARDINNLLMSIAVHPAEGKMYLANWTEGSVEVLGMDGTRLQRLVSGLKQPRSLTIDLYGNERQLYWLESVDHKGQRSTTIVKACYLENGESCRVVYKSSPGNRPSSLTVLANNVYWLDGYKINYIGPNQKTRPRKIELSNKQLDSQCLKVVHSYTQPLTTNNCVFTSCQGLCVPLPRDLGQTDVRSVLRKSKYKPPRHFASIGLVTCGTPEPEESTSPRDTLHL